MGDLLRVATAGSVDDGKSTLIGRLLFDSKSIFEDQLDALERFSVQRGGNDLDLSLLTDGLRAEREQGITIDVAYRFFATPRRTFIIADTRGHVQYTRNMVTGASTAGAALVLVDARRGVSEQSRRHLFIASLLRIPHIVIAVNKMDLVDFDVDVFEAIRDELSAFAQKLDVGDLTFVPISALDGDNVVWRSAETPWYDGAPLLGHLEQLHVASDRNLIDCRVAVQYVLDDVGVTPLLGCVVAGGVLRVGDDIVVLPCGERSRVGEIATADGPLREAPAGSSIAVLLADDVNVGRGDLLCRPNNRPVVGSDLDAMLCWMSEVPVPAGTRLLLKHLTRTVVVTLEDVRYRLDVNTLHREEGVGELALNEIGRVSLSAAAPIAYDDYARNRQTGSFILIDEQTNATVAAGMLRAP